MAAKTKHFDVNKVESLALWWRKITPAFLRCVLRCRRVHAAVPYVRVGWVSPIKKHLAEESRAAKTGGFIGRGGLTRAGTLDMLNQKLDLLLGSALSSGTFSAKTPVQMLADGDGVVLWLPEPDLQQSDLIELHFFPNTPIPWSIHCFCRVMQLQAGWTHKQVRVECQFEPLASPVPMPVPAGKAVVTQIDMATRNDSPMNWPKFPVRTDVYDSYEKRADTGVNVNTKSKAPESKVAHRTSGTVKSTPELPALKASDVDDKYDKLLKEGMSLAHAELKDLEKTAGRKSPSGKKAAVSRDFRINDRIPFIWSCVSQRAFQEAMIDFHKNRNFGLRAVVAKQQKLLFQLDDYLSVLQRKRARSRKHVDWHRNRLSWLFLRATSENEEAYFQGLTTLFIGIVSELTSLTGGGDQAVNHILVYLKDLMENAQLRDQLNPLIDVAALAKVGNNLAELHRQIPQLIQKIGGNSAVLAREFLLFYEGVTAIDLTQLDRPVGISADGKDLYAVNISATGIAFRTRKLWVKKDDLLEMRVFLSTGGTHFDPVNVFGKVVFVQGPEDNKVKVGTHITPRPAEFEQKIFTHIARKQREKLVERSGVEGKQASGLYEDLD